VKFEFLFSDSVPKASSPLLISPPSMTPGVTPPMTLPLSNVSPSTVLPAVSPTLIPNTHSPVTTANSNISPVINQSSPIQIASLSNATTVIQPGPPPKPAPPAAPSRKSKIQ